MSLKVKLPVIPENFLHRRHHHLLFQEFHLLFPLNFNRGSQKKRSFIRGFRLKERECPGKELCHRFRNQGNGRQMSKDHSRDDSCCR